MHMGWLVILFLNYLEDIPMSLLECGRSGAGVTGEGLEIKMRCTFREVGSAGKNAKGMGG